jgi:predicted phosphoadenosine phosphosulfate sulfurtransferase
LVGAVAKLGLGKDVLVATMDRIKRVFDDFDRVYVSFSAGKDSSVLLHLAVAEAALRGRKLGVLLIDLEAQYALTIEHAEEMCRIYAEHIDLYWVALPLSLRNAVSNYEPRWQCWDPDRRADWVREPSALSITDPSVFPFFRRGMEFEEFVDEFSHWYADGKATACLVGIRADESLNRFRTLIADKTRQDGLCWTTWKGEGVFNAYPIYDWRTEDIWTFVAKFGAEQNRIYDRMHAAGVPLSQQRICQPYGDDQRRGLWLYHVLEPETWGKVVARVNGANSGALYAKEIGNIMGRTKVTLPPGHTWESFSRLLLETLPPAAREHYENKIAVFLKWYTDRGYPRGIPDEGPVNTKDAPSWTRIAKMLLRNDWWAKGLSFTQTKSESYERYKKIMAKRRQLWAM